VGHCDTIGYVEKGICYLSQRSNQVELMQQGVVSNGADEEEYLNYECMVL
jgi:hypothetical protein